MPNYSAKPTITYYDNSEGKTPGDFLELLETVDGKEVVTKEIKGDELQDLLANSKGATDEEIQKLMSEREMKEGDVGGFDLNVHSGEKMDGTDGVEDFFIADTEADSTITDFNVDEDSLGITSDTFTFEDVKSRVDDKGLHLSWEGGSVFLEGVTEAPKADDSWFSVTDPADMDISFDKIDPDAPAAKGDDANALNGLVELSISGDGGHTWQEVSPEDYGL